MTILQSAKDKINKRAYSRYLSNKKSNLQALDIKEIIRKGDETYKKDSHGLLCESESVFGPVRFVPDGFRRFELKRSARAEKEAGVTASGGALAPLVLPAKSQSGFLESVDQNTGEIQRLETGKTPSDFKPVFVSEDALVNRYVLQAEAREILKSETRLNDVGRPVPVYRVCDCLRNKASGVNGVSVVGSSLSESARFSGLQTCGSVWHCPVCSARISEVRRKQISEMVDIWQKSGKGVIFITNTIRHDRNDDLRLMLSNLLDLVWNRYINHWTYKKLRKSLGYIGRVRSIEVTHGQNGWHPHIHEIWLIEKDLTIAELKKVQSKLFKVWNVTLCNAGMAPVSAARGVTVQNGSKAADYISKFGHEPKWDIGRELTQSHSKKASGKGRTPFDLLRDSVQGDLDASRLFKEYAVAFAGKRQLYFSTGLKDFFLLDYRTDDEIASSATYDTTQLAFIDSDSWRLVLGYGSRPVVLLLARSGGNEAVQEYVQTLKTKCKNNGHKVLLFNG